ncbi:MAG TPA: RNA 2',3'-cyclic phosphodiesterase [Lentisphaeria bacterium]|nr:MAG: 2'-5' RNA ligase [Lentisphaerae bacterium GWF2_49_21]HBC87381.1 RNA 2',3'-cyclic phosphodiesterase [Lentisphaeria bacterium]
MPRLFIAIDMPDELRGKICEVRRNLPGVRWVDKEQIHLTLRFIGDSDDENSQRIKSALAEVKFKSFRLEMDGAGFFPNERRPTVFWIGCKKNSVLTELKKGIDDILEMNGLPPEGRRFVPHITIARLKNIQPGEIRKLSGMCSGVIPLEFTVPEFMLYSSVLTSGGAIHTKEQVYSSLG